MVALIASLWAYDGWNDLTMVAGEVKRPERSLPIALIAGVGVVGVLYMATNAAIQYILPAAIGARAIRDHWGIENRLHYVRDCGFREDDSRIRSKPTIFARLRSFAANILRANNVQNLSDGRYRIAIAGLAGLRSLILV